MYNTRLYFTLYTLRSIATASEDWVIIEEGKTMVCLKTKKKNVEAETS
jgi:hypothetical protein